MQTSSKKLAARVLFSTFAIMMAACGRNSSPETSGVKVTNGINLNEREFPAVVLLSMQHPDGLSICTGTFVNDHQLVTAAHCVEGLDPARPQLSFAKNIGARAKRVRAVRFKRNPLYSIVDNYGVNQHDLAVVTFPAGSAPALAPIASASPELESPLTIVGYGNNRNFLTADGQLDGSGSGKKRMGHNVLADKSDGFLSFLGVPASAAGLEAGELASGGGGDSGGPMFINNELVGVTSGGGMPDLEDGSMVVVSHYVDLNTAESRKFLQKELD